VRWVAAQLGHSNPELSLRVYAHAMREEETDLSFLGFGGTGRHLRGTSARSQERESPSAQHREGALETWSARRVSNPRPAAWEGGR
jgi:hypothetical protein